MRRADNFSNYVVVRCAYILEKDSQRMPNWFKRFLRRVREKKSFAGVLNYNRGNRAREAISAFDTGARGVTTIERRTLRFTGKGGDRAMESALKYGNAMTLDDSAPGAKGVSREEMEALYRSAEASDKNKKRGKGKNSPYKLTGLTSTKRK